MSETAFQPEGPLPTGQDTAPPERPPGEPGSLAPVPVTSGTPARPTRNWRPFLLIVGAILGTVILVKGVIGLYYRFTGPPIPAPDLAELDPKVVKAIKVGQDLVARNPGSAEAWGHLGKVLRAHDIIPESNVCFRRTEELDPADPRWPYLLGRGLLPSHPEEALACLQRAVERGDAVFSPRLYLAEQLIDRGRLDEAEALVRVVLDKEPDDPRAHQDMGRIALRRNQLEQSLDHLLRSAAKAPDARATHATLAQVHSRMGNAKAAAEELRRMAPLDEEWSWPDPSRRRSWRPGWA